MNIGYLIESWNVGELWTFCGNK